MGQGSGRSEPLGVAAREGTFTTLSAKNAASSDSERIIPSAQDTDSLFGKGPVNVAPQHQAMPTVCEQS
jgi:hypothetical protein